MASAVFFLDLKGKVRLMRIGPQTVKLTLYRPSWLEITEVIFLCQLSKSSLSSYQKPKKTPLQSHHASQTKA